MQQILVEAEVDVEVEVEAAILGRDPHLLRNNHDGHYCAQVRIWLREIVGRERHNI